MNQMQMGTFSYVIQPGDTFWILAERFATTVDSIMAVNPGVNPNNLIPGSMINIPMGQSFSNVEDEGNYFTEAEMELNNTLRMLWEQHISWTRMTIMDIIYDLPELNFAVARLLRNPEDFANFFRQFYGDEIAEQIKVLLTDHLVIAADLVKAAKAGDTNQAATLEQRWFQNADDIAKALAFINPYWDQEAWRDMLYEHLRLVKEEATLFLENEFEKNILLYDDMERNAMEMADMMFEGLIRQFPDEFE